MTLAAQPATLQPPLKWAGGKRQLLPRLRPGGVIGFDNVLWSGSVADATNTSADTVALRALNDFLVRDEPNARKWTSGFLTSRGKVKPSFNAYALPFVQVSRHRTRTMVWGQVRPRFGRQSYRLQQFSGGRWRWIGATQLTTSGGFLRRVVSAGPHARLRIWSPRDRRSSMVLTVR